MHSEESLLYVRYIDGSNAYFQVPNRRREDGLYEILPHQEFDYEDDSTLFEFGPGDVVETVLFRFDDGAERRLASRLIKEGDPRNVNKRLLFLIASGKPSVQDLISQYGEHRVRNIKSDIAQLKSIYPAISDWIDTNTERIDDLCDRRDLPH